MVFQRMLDTIRRGFERYGFVPVETPVFEIADVLTHDRHFESQGTYATGAPMEAVDPRTVGPCLAGELTDRAWGEADGA